MSGSLLRQLIGTRKLFCSTLRLATEWTATNSFLINMAQEIDKDFAFRVYVY